MKNFRFTSKKRGNVINYSCAPNTAGSCRLTLEGKAGGKQFKAVVGQGK
jgi:hypothetical protein